MRFLLCSVAMIPGLAWAETFTLNSRATEALLYAAGGLISHDVTVTVPAGTHELIFPDLPPELWIDQLRLAAPDLKIGAIRYRDDFVPPRQAESEVIKAAEAQIDNIEDQIRQVEDQASLEDAAADAARDQIDFLKGLMTGSPLSGNADAMRSLLGTIRDDLIAARRAIVVAEQTARQTRSALEDLKDDLRNAKAALKALVPEAEDRPYLSVEVFAATDVANASIRVSYLTTEANWTPIYDFRLSSGSDTKLTIDRFAGITQSTGENWSDISLTLSTQEPLSQIDPAFLSSDLRRLIDPETLQIKRRGLAADGVVSMTMEAPVLVEESAASTAVSESGLSLTYSFSAPVSVATGADQVRIPFDSLEMPAELVARAVPLRDDRAYLVAKFTNTSGEPILASETATRFFDGAFVGSAYVAEIPSGKDVELGFGPIDGLTLDRKVLRRNEGDRGLISKSNEQTETVRITARNLTERTWQMELLDRVPYSEQEDLEISYTANPAPDLRNVDDRRGILQWNAEMEPGAEKTIETTYEMNWPEGQVVR